MKSSPEARCSLATTYNRAGNLEAAIDAYNIAITLRPSYAEAFLGLRMVLKKRGHAD